MHPIHFKINMTKRQITIQYVEFCILICVFLFYQWIDKIYYKLLIKILTICWLVIICLLLISYSSYFFITKCVGNIINCIKYIISLSAKVKWNSMNSFLNKSRSMPAMLLNSDLSISILYNTFTFLTISLCLFKVGSIHDNY